MMSYLDCKGGFGWVLGEQGQNMANSWLTYVWNIVYTLYAFKPS